jgi:hypothetical protein
LDLSDPALWAALVLGVLGFVVYAKLRVKPPPLPRCAECGLTMEREEEIVDAENPERRFIPGEREAYFACPRGHRRTRARY